MKMAVPHNIKNVLLLSAFTLVPAMLASPMAAYADMREAVHSEQSGTIVRSTSGECVRTKWMTGNDACSTAAVQPPAAPPIVQQQVITTIAREDRTVYFGFNQTALTPQMQGRLDTLATNLLNQQNVKGARIVGYADRIGNPQYNETLSKKRAQNVKNYLIARGVINTQVADTRWLGESEPATSCPNNLKRPVLIDCLQKDRRVEVEVDYLTQTTQASR